MSKSWVCFFAFFTYVNHLNNNNIFTLDIVEESGSSNGSAQSTTNSPPQAFRLLEVNLLLAADALLCESYSRKANPRFFHFGLSADPYTITSTNPSASENENMASNFKGSSQECLKELQTKLI